MLTADLVLARRRGRELRLVRLDGARRARATTIAEAVVRAIEAGVGGARDDVEDAIEAVDVEPREVRWRAGLAKLALDRCAWGEEEGAEAPAIRRDVFRRAAAVRRALGAGARFDRDAVLRDVAKERGTDASALERALYADLRGAQTLTAFDAIGPAGLVDAWERGQAQAVLLRATKIALDVRCASPGATRALFRRLKFLRLLHVITKAERGHRIVIDGPLNLFESSTKYGLQLALVVPVLEGCDEWALEADVRWGKNREPLVFRASGGLGDRGARARLDGPPLPDEIAALARAVQREVARESGGWRVSPSAAILELPGVGLCVPDLVFERGDDRVYLEVMGFWSRDAVWRRVELVEAGLGAPIVFAVSSRLRVSEEVIGEDAAGALYVYKGTMGARAVIERVEALAARRRGRGGRS
jgi:predicted nuclease of restriction endonuclease-like RecB superfamily